jgi:hypothetical protein
MNISAANKVGLAFFALVGFAIIAAILVLALVFTGCDESLHRFDKPLSLEAASKDRWVSSLPFPHSTSDVYYLHHVGGMQEFQFAVRFTVDPKDLNGAVSNLCSDFDKTTKERHFYASAPIADAPHSPDLDAFSPMPWWGPSSITNGYSLATTNGQAFYLWIDVTRHTIYLCETD